MPEGKSHTSFGFGTIFGAGRALPSFPYLMGSSLATANRTPCFRWQK